MSPQQLKEELALRGLKRTGKREELVQRLKDAEGQMLGPQTSGPAVSDKSSHKLGQQQREIDHRPEDIEKQDSDEKHATPDSLLESSLKTLTKDQLILEIKQRNPSAAFNARLSKQKLLEILKPLLEPMPAQQTEVLTVRTLLARLNTQREDVPLKDIFFVLRGIADLETISQNDFNVLIQTHSPAFYTLWTTIYTHIPSLSSTDVLTLLRAMDLFKNTLKKDLGSGAPDVDSAALDSLAARLSSISRKCPLSDLSLAVELLQSLQSDSKVVSDTLKSMKEGVLHRVAKGSVAGMSAGEMFTVFEALPERAYEEKREEVSELIQLLFAKRLNWSNERVLTALHKLYEIKAPVPIYVTSAVSAFSKDFLMRLNPLSLFSFVKLMCLQRCFTLASAKIVFHL